jgi:signal transduction histidine kinase
MAAHTHSLKTPLAVIKLRCDLIRMWDQIPDALQADLMELGEDVNRLSSTIENSLRLFKFHAGSTGAFKEPLSPEWLGSHVAEIQGLLAPNDVGYQVELCPEAVLATPDCLQLALQTVLENAHLHGGLPVSVITRDLGDRILLRIEDHGQGIPPETVLQVQRFRRPRPWHRASQEAASGLGLYLLARLAQEEGWGLHVRCVAGQGTSISLELHRPSATRA